MKTKTSALLAALVAIAPVWHSAMAAPAAAPRRPNIVFFLSDDHAYQTIGAYGSTLMPTPNLDRIAREGMRFDRAFCTESICGPSRAAILTGKYGHVTGAMGWLPYDHRHRNFAEYLRASGYQTALVGKYHQGDDPVGFDYYDILPGQGVYENPTFVSTKGQRVIPGHVSDVIGDLSLAWLEQRDPDRPFVICINDKAAHMSWTPAVRHRTMFDGRDIPEPASIGEDRSKRAEAVNLTWLKVDQLSRWQAKHWGEPPAGLTPEQRRSWLYQKMMKSYLGCVAGIDDNVGRVLDWLERNHLAEDTIVIYASDQGFILGEHGWFDKRWMIEESLRLPLLVRYPRLIKPGSVEKAMALNTDFAPTLLDLAGVPVPADMQGRSLRPVLAGHVPADWRHSIYYRYYATEFAMPPHYGVRTERYKLIHYQGPVIADDGSPVGDNKHIAREIDEWELLDLQADPKETTNFYHDPKYQTVAADLHRELDRLAKELGDTPGKSGLNQQGRLGPMTTGPETPPVKK
jgi:arylsulfatase A-like enzyme